MANEELKKAFEEAAEIAKIVPKELQEAAFRRALDELLGVRSGTSQPSGRPSPSRTQRKGKEKQEATEEDPDGLERVIDTTKHPQIFDAKRVLEKSLLLLRAANDDYGVDGLTAPEIASILTNKFESKPVAGASRRPLTDPGSGSIAEL